MASGRHGAHEHTRIVDVVLHADPIAQEGSPCEGAGRIDGNDRYLLAGRAQLDQEGIHER
jgi:hypothetical protein